MKRNLLFVVIWIATSLLLWGLSELGAAIVAAKASGALAFGLPFFVPTRKTGWAKGKTPNDVGDALESILCWVRRESASIGERIREALEIEPSCMTVRMNRIVSLVERADDLIEYGDVNDAIAALVNASYLLGSLRILLEREGIVMSESRERNRRR